jgi:hypothetical protein
VTRVATAVKRVARGAPSVPRLRIDGGILAFL